MIAVVDYGVGNLFSLCSSLKSVGADIYVGSDAIQLQAAEKIVLPGVGAFADAMAALRERGIDALLKEEAAAGKPIMGICLGMQVLFQKSYEYGEHEGLGLLQGEVIPMQGNISEDLKIPHIGWNALEIKKQSALLQGVTSGDYVYFVHSFYASNCDSSIIATTDYGAQITAAVQKGNVMGCQFHPEKSGDVGMKILRAFCECEF